MSIPKTELFYHKQAVRNVQFVTMPNGQRESRLEPGRTLSRLKARLRCVRTSNGQRESRLEPGFRFTIGIGLLYVSSQTDQEGL